MSGSIIETRIGFRYYNGRVQYRLNKDESVFCCDKLEKVVGYDDGYGFSIDEHTGKAQLRLSIYRDYYDGESGENHSVDFCPFCGEKITVKKSKTKPKLDKTGYNIVKAFLDNM